MYFYNIHQERYITKKEYITNILKKTDARVKFLGSRNKLSIHQNWVGYHP